ncbi:hypothetical protein ACPV5S_15615 [Vibrio astriarenae]
MKIEKWLFGLVLISFSAVGQDFTYETTEIMDKRKDPRNSQRSIVTLLMADSFDRSYSVECTYYQVKGEDSKVIASTNHVALKATPEWTVKARVDDIDFAICKGVKK